MWEDPIVGEIHRVREKLAAKYNYDIDAFFADLMKRQEALGGRLVRQKKKAEPASEVGQGRDLGTPGCTPTEERNGNQN